MTYNLTTSANPFGFLKAHSTHLCIILYALKEFIEHYKSTNTTLFVTFLDASKAFDRIDHWVLLKKLIAKDVPLLIKRLILYWYSTNICALDGETHFLLYLVYRMV